MKEGDGEGKGAEEKLKRLRKRNAELVALARQLDEKTKSLKAENEQLVCADPPPSSPSLSSSGLISIEYRACTMCTCIHVCTS